MKKLLAGCLVIWLTLVLFTGSFGTIASARAATSGDYDYTVAGGNATITKYTGRKGVVVIPNTLGGCPVTSIGSDAFAGCLFLTSVTFPSSVAWIGDAAFQGCAALTSVIVRGDEPSCGERAFQGCEKMTVVHERGTTGETFGQTGQNKGGKIILFSIIFLLVLLIIFGIRFALQRLSN